MKTLRKCLACSASLMVLTALSPAQTSSQGTSQSGSGAGSQQQPSSSQPSSRQQQPGSGQMQSSVGQMQSSQQQQFMQTRNLLGKEAKSAQGQSLGKVHDITFQPQTGEIFAVLDLGNNRYTPVPWQALNVSGAQGAEPQITLNTTREKLQSGPALSGQQWQTDLSRPGFTQQIYSHYNLQPPSGMGASGTAPSGTIRGGSSQQQQQTYPGSSQQHQPGASQQPGSSQQQQGTSPQQSRDPRQPF